MLTFYHGISMDLLAGELIALLRSEPPEDPLEPEKLIVQNHGMARWLSLRIADETGIAANMKFRFPAEELWDIYRSMEKGIPAGLPSDREPMTWTIYRILGELDDREPYRMLWRYMRDDNGNWDPLKSWKLAEKVGDIFDRYLNYRPEMLLRWEDIAINELVPAEAWQAGLWKRMNRVWDNIHPDLRWHHRPEIHKAFMDRLNKKDIPERLLPGRIVLFSLSGLQPQAIELFVNISSIVDVHWFGLDLVRQKPEHPLVESWGGEGRDFMHLFERYRSTAGIEAAFVDVEEKKGSSGITGSFFSGRQSGNRLPKGLQVQIHACHSPLREIEVLYDRLLDMLQNTPGLTIDDILVLIPDVESYAPFVEAVFGTGEDRLPELPFHFVDRSAGARRAVFRTFASILDILDGRFKVTETVDLLSSGPILDRLELNNQELDQLTRWIEETKIRWGIDGVHKAELGLPESSSHTWQSGIDRMILGFSSHYERDLFNGIFPFEHIESGSDADLLGKLALFFSKLKKARTQAVKKHSPSEWVQLLSGWIEAFFPTKHGYSGACGDLENLLVRMREASERGGFRQFTGYTVIREYLEERLSFEEGRGGYSGHGITFCGPDQMRNIPFRAVCMIGMNSSVYPRGRTAPHFDLMVNDPKPGDKVRREDDRFLFLETLNSAGDILYISYTGQSNRDDSVLLPSVMISELIDYLAEKRGCSTEEIIQRHPLHAYSQQYFDEEETNLFSYSSDYFEISKKISEGSRHKHSFIGQRLPEAGSEFGQLSLSDLVRFYENPSRYLLQERVGLYLSDEALLTEEREPMELDGLLRYQLSEELLMLRLGADDTLDSYEPVARAKGLLPEGWVGEQAFRDTREEVDRFCEAISPLLRFTRSEPGELNMEAGECRITGTIENLNDRYQLFVKYSSFKAKYLIKSWIYHLALQEVEGGTRKSLLITREDDKPGYYLFNEVKNHREILGRLAHYYWKGIHREVPFFAESSFAYAYEVLINKKESEAALAGARKKWMNSWKPELGESENLYIKKIYEDKDPIGTQEFKDISLIYWRPVFDCMKEGEEHLAEV